MSPVTSRPRRTAIRAGLDQIYLPFYDALCDILSSQWQPFCGFRSINEQNDLYAKGRSVGIPGKIVTNAKGGQSPHNYGCATDWIIFKNKTPIWLKANAEEWEEYAQACEKVGLVWGGGFKTLKADNVHNELSIKLSWKKDIAKTYFEQGLQEAMALIHSSVLK